MSKEDNLTCNDARKFFSYDKETGEIKWRMSKSPAVKKGDTAGCMHPSGYIRIKIDGVYFYAHRVIWLIVTGEWPRDKIDHINHNGVDNRWANLREADHFINMKNLPLNSRNMSGVTGVHFCNTWKKWKANIKVDNKRITLGTFDDFFEAVCARKSANIKYNFHENHGRQRQ